MKKPLLYLCSFLLFANGFPQKNKNAKYKEYEGRYGHMTNGLCLFEDGTFLLYGFATAVFGTYQIKKKFSVLS